MKKILITGLCGFIGAHIIEHILKTTDWEIVGIDRLSYASTGFDRIKDIEAFDNKRFKLLCNLTTIKYIYCTRCITTSFLLYKLSYLVANMISIDDTLELLPSSFVIFQWARKNFSRLIEIMF